MYVIYSSNIEYSNILLSNAIIIINEWRLKLHWTQTNRICQWISIDDQQTGLCVMCILATIVSTFLLELSFLFAIATHIRTTELEKFILILNIFKMPTFPICLPPTIWYKYLYHLWHFQHLNNYLNDKTQRATLYIFLQFLPAIVYTVLYNFYHICHQHPYFVLYFKFLFLCFSSLNRFRLKK